MSPQASPIANVARSAPPPELLISPLAGGEERSAKQTESQLLGFPSDERPER